MKIGVISDTHMPARARELPAELLAALHAVDMILHAGDLTTADVLESLRAIAPTVAVRGNVDSASVRVLLPDKQVIEADGFRIGLVHGDGSSLSTLERARRAFSDVDCIVFGHSHVPTVEKRGSVLMVNPGSPTDPRREPRPSYAIISTNGAIEAKIRYL